MARRRATPRLGHRLVIAHEDNEFETALTCFFSNALPYFIRAAVIGDQRNLMSLRSPIIQIRLYRFTKLPWTDDDDIGRRRSD